ncbi:MAG: glycosyltransferase [Candidatus Marinimicrobia bacterium]|nr:glycosyltransferase [Candidatus Neomarinimicrobiota bacterium]
MTERRKNILQGQDIILISNQMLEDRYWTSKQYITQELKKQNRVLYVEANYSFGKLFLGIMQKTWPVAPFGSLRNIEDSLWVLTPFPRLPWRNQFRFFGWLNQVLLKYKIKRAIRVINFDRPVLWTFLHQTADIVSTLNEKVAIYHCVDDWPALLPMAKMGNPKTIIADEDHLIRKVDIVFRVSEKLLSDRSVENTPLVEIPNGVDFERFNAALHEEVNVPSDLKDLSRPIIGFSGSIGPWIDIDLIRKVAQKNPEASVVLIGLNEKNSRLKSLLEEKNIHFLGMKQRTEVPNYLANFDVCLMPFDKGQVGEGLLPLKMFEYLAVGKPIVAISSKTMHDFINVLFLAEDDDSFLAKMDEAIQSAGKSELIEARIRVAQDYSWEKRVQQYGLQIDTYLHA